MPLRAYCGGKLGSLSEKKKILFSALHGRSKL